jgi:hypothetical protein
VVAGQLLTQPLRQAVLVIRQDRAVLGDHAPGIWWRLQASALDGYAAGQHNLGDLGGGGASYRLKVPSTLIAQKSCGRPVATMNAVKGRGVHDGADAVDRPGKIIGAMDVALDQFVVGVDGPQVEQPRGMPGRGQGRDDHPAQVAAGPGHQHLHVETASVLVGRRPRVQPGRAVRDSACLTKASLRRLDDSSLAGEAVGSDAAA